MAAAALTTGLLGCGSGLGGMQTYNCCVNKQFYVCPDKETFTQCFSSGDISECTRDPSKDIGCPVKY
ncbi:MAG TPA: hypothetical protein PLW65_05615 [Pseudomonadota bacterium]|nr:hypothetical protein [Pseudomonadota bacterium]